MGLLDAPTVPARQVRHLQRDTPVPVATRANPALDSGTTPSSGLLGGTARTLHTATRTAHGIQVAYTNWYTVAGGPAEADGVNDLYVSAAIYYNATVFPLRFGGQRQARVAPGGVVLSDPCGVEIPKGSAYSILTWVGVDAGGSFPRNINLINGAEGHNYSAAGGPDLTASGGAGLSGQNLNSAGYGPSAILGRVIDPGKPVILLAGDSILYGTQDTSTGYGVRALAGNYSFQKIAMPGEALSQFIGSSGLFRHRRMALAELCGVTHVLTDYTVNSLSATTIQADVVTAWMVLSRYGPVTAASLTPQTSSTDAWATTTNQAVLYPSDREPRRVAFNGWLRDGAPINGITPQAVGASGDGVVRAGQPGHPLANVVEVADLAETARNSGIWRAGYTSDGTHPNPTGAAALAAAIDPTVFGPAAS